jgi:VWFA-related protein
MSVAFALDYSGSITDVPENVYDMQDAVADFIRQLGDDDEAEIIKFDSKFEVVQGFTSDKTLLLNAIYADWDNGRQTTLYDAVSLAAEDTAGRSNPRKAVIVVTDGVDKPEGDPVTTLDEVITTANTGGIPVFTIGLGNIQDVVLEQMAADTGGQFYEAATSDNLGNVYQQLVDLLLEDQYILTYVSGLGIGDSADLTIKVDSSSSSGEAVKRITPCP